MSIKTENSMGSAYRAQMLHSFADTVRQGGTVDLDEDGKLEVRTAGVAKQVFYGLVPEQYQIKVKPEMFVQLNTFLSKVAEELSPTDLRARQDLEVMKSYLARAYFGRSRTYPYTALLIGLSNLSPITSTSFTQSHANFVQRHVEEITLYSRVDEIETSIHNQCAQLFVTFFQRAIEEGQKGHYHIEHMLLYLAEAFMIGYYDIMEDSTIKEELNRRARVIHHIALMKYQAAVGYKDSFHLTFGGLYASSFWAGRAASQHIEQARAYAREGDADFLSKMLETFSELNPDAIHAILKFLHALPKTVEVANIQSHLISALRLKTLAAIKFDPKNLNTIWSKQIAIRLLKDRIKYFEGEANYHHRRIYRNYQDLQLKVKNLESQMAAGKSVIEELETALPHAKSQILSIHESFKKLSSEYQETKEKLESLPSHLSEKNIELSVLCYPARKNCSEQMISCLGKLDDRVLINDSELDLEVAVLKEAYHFFKQRAEDLQEVLPDPLAAMFD